jgi:hypothetical protein
MWSFVNRGVVAAASLAQVWPGALPRAEASLNKPSQPLRGWNSYDAFGVTDEVATLAVADGLVSSGLFAAGYSYLTLDAGWFGDVRIDAWGRPVGSAQLYPSAAADGSLKSLADAVHARGLHFGLWYMAGVPHASYASNSPIKGTNFTVRGLSPLVDFMSSSAYIARTSAAVVSRLNGCCNAAIVLLCHSGHCVVCLSMIVPPGELHGRARRCATSR